MEKWGIFATPRDNQAFLPGSTVNRWRNRSGSSRSQTNHLVCRAYFPTFLTIVGFTTMRWAITRGSSLRSGRWTPGGVQHSTSDSSDPSEASESSSSSSSEFVLPLPLREGFCRLWNLRHAAWMATAARSRLRWSSLACSCPCRSSNWRCRLAMSPSAVLALASSSRLTAWIAFSHTLFLQPCSTVLRVCTSCFTRLALMFFIAPRFCCTRPFHAAKTELSCNFASTPRAAAAHSATCSLCLCTINAAFQAATTQRIRALGSDPGKLERAPFSWRFFCACCFASFLLLSRRATRAAWFARMCFRVSCWAVARHAWKDRSTNAATSALCMVAIQRCSRS
mmetsp:Transcript_4027/g.9710  ORF Transcript_4027/g.9710 Transcript_4027/m.9710 type:complete len:338 (-) Transcript_4027:649-1662(-)